MSDILNVNLWNVVYSISPDFEKFNDRFSKNPISAALMIPLAALIGTSYFPQSPPLINRAALFSGLGILAAKGLFMIGTSLQRKVWEKTDEGKETLTWGALAPPSEMKTTDHSMACKLLEKKIKNSFPNPQLFKLLADKDPRVLPPQPESYTTEQLIQDCDAWMNHALAVATAVKDDLKQWSESGRFNHRKNGELLSAQPGLNRKIHSVPWLYRGFFYLPVAYRYIFNLPGTLSELKTLPPYCKNEAEKFETSYPESNKKALAGWQEQFFAEGTKQSEWRQKYNAAMQAIFEQAGEIEDERFSIWGSAHDNQDFSRFPGQLPT